MKAIAEKLSCSTFGEKLLLLASDICLLTPHLGSMELCRVTLTLIYTIGKTLNKTRERIAMKCLLLLS